MENLYERIGLMRNGYHGRLYVLRVGLGMDAIEPTDTLPGRFDTRIPVLADVQSDIETLRQLHVDNLDHIMLAQLHMLEDQEAIEEYLGNRENGEELREWMKLLPPVEHNDD
jgi:hypothetical protein